MKSTEPTFYTRDGKQTAIMKKILFNDSIERYICSHEHVPESYWPNTVYIYNIEKEEYIEIGSYFTKETTSTQWFNSQRNLWEGHPSVKTYYYVNKIN